MRMDRIEELLNKPYWIIDVLPERVPENSPGRYFAVEDYFLKEQLEENKNTISSLRKQLEDKNFIISDLNDDLNLLNEKLSSQNDELIPDSEFISNEQFTSSSNSYSFDDYVELQKEYISLLKKYERSQEDLYNEKVKVIHYKNLLDKFKNFILRIQ